MKLLPNLAIGRTRLAVLDFTVLYTFSILTCLPGEADSLVLLTPGGHHPLLVLLHRQDLQSLLLMSQRKMNNLFFPKRATGIFCLSEQIKNVKNPVPPTQIYEMIIIHH